ncbi:hypothetical protein C0995_001593 [Termitomyces sp. Mi166|nr:hypothetical protein C0995_001593 [Termitomyces sp. Mi166\
MKRTRSLKHYFAIALVATMIYAMYSEFVGLWILEFEGVGSVVVWLRRRRIKKIPISPTMVPDEMPQEASQSAMGLIATPRDTERLDAMPQRPLGSLIDRNIPNIGLVRQDTTRIRLFWVLIAVIVVAGARARMERDAQVLAERNPRRLEAGDDRVSRDEVEQEDEETNEIISEDLTDSNEIEPSPGSRIPSRFRASSPSFATTPSTPTPAVDDHEQLTNALVPHLHLRTTRRLSTSLVSLPPTTSSLPRKRTYTGSHLGLGSSLVRCKAMPRLRQRFYFVCTADDGWANPGYTHDEVTFCRGFNFKGFRWLGRGLREIAGRSHCPRNELHDGVKRAEYRRRTRTV